MIFFFGTSKSNEDDLIQSVFGITSSSDYYEQGQQAESKGKKGKEGGSTPWGNCG